jgi:hypothetical protein
MGIILAKVKGSRIRGRKRIFWHNEGRSGKVEEKQWRRE